MLLNGRVAFITGASKGIGRDLSLAFARHGAKVICTSRSKVNLDETVSLVHQNGGEAIAVVCDAAVESDVVAAAKAGAQKFGRINVLVNNAGEGGPVKPIEEYTFQEWQSTINSCLTSSYVSSKHLVPELKKAGHGSIIMISSISGLRGAPLRTGYCAAKAGQLGLTYCLALELAKSDITVNCIAPTAVEGDRIEGVIEGLSKVNGVTSQAFRENLLNQLPLGRLVKPSDVSELAVFLASVHARNISGQAIGISAGVTAL